MHVADLKTSHDPLYSDACVFLVACTVCVCALQFHSIHCKFANEIMPVMWFNESKYIEYSRFSRIEATHLQGAV